MKQPPTRRKKSSGVGLTQAVVNTALHGGDLLLTKLETAAKLNTSPPYVSMLCSAGKLGEVVTDQAGHRRIRSSEVDAYIAERKRQHETALSPQAAGVAAGLYDYPDSHFVRNFVREPNKLQATNTRKKG